jgi:hypothetical protein
MECLKMLKNYSTERQQLAFGARLIWERTRGMSDAKFDKFLAIACIKMQTYFSVKVPGDD